MTCIDGTFRDAKGRAFMKKWLLPAVAAAVVIGMRFMTLADGDAYIASTTNGTVYSINTGYKIKPTTGIYADFEFLARVADVFPDKNVAPNDGNSLYQQFVFESTGGGVARFYINGQQGAGAIAWNFTKEEK